MLPFADLRESRPRLWAHTLGTYTTRDQRCVSPEHIRTLDGLIDRPIAPYLFIFHRVLAPGTISSFSRSFSLFLFYVPTTYIRRERKIWNPHAYTLSMRVALYQFFQRGTTEIFTKTDRLSYSRQTKKWGGERAQLVNATLRFGKLPSRGNKCWCDRMNLILSRTQFNEIYDIQTAKELFNLISTRIINTSSQNISTDNSLSQIYIFFYYG